MSEEQPAQRKVGSLRDRIAQFETKPAAPPSVPPKPAVPQKKWAWKDKQAEAPAHPPPPPAASASSSSPPQDAAPAPERDSWSDVSTHQDVPAKSTPAPAPAFSAADAASSIAAGGGLKARLAALQGSGFGSTPETSNAPPPPPAGKPRVWKKAIVTYEAPPKPERPRPAEDENPETEEERHHDHHDDEHEAHTHPETAEEGEAEAAAPEEPKDPEEEERQRRAAIAARMARLGGARVGMGMPVFGMKPPVPAPIRKDSGTDTEATPAPARQASASPPVPKREPSFEEPSESVRDSVAETEMTNEEETTTEATESKEDVSHHEVLPTPASPPRPRPPIPVARAWSNSPPASPKKRPEVISQEDSAAVEEVEGSREGKEVGGGDEKEGPSQGHQKGLKDEGEDEKDEGSEKKKPSPDAPVPTALALALQIDKPEPVLEVTTSPPSIPTSARPTSASPASASSGKPLPPMPKRAPPPRRKMPTPKVSSEAVPTVTSPPVPELPAHPEDEKPKEDVEAKPDAVEKAPVEEKVVAPPAETGAGHEPAPVEADTAVSDPVEPAHDKDDSLSKEVKKEAPAEVRGSEELGATGGEEKKVDDEKPIESSKPVEKATGGEFDGPAKSVDTKKGKRRASQQSTPSRSASISVSQPPRGLHEVSPRASSDRPRQAEASPARVESPQPDEAAKESERKQQLAQRMAKLGGVGIPGQRPTPVRKPSKQASEVQSPPAESGSVVSRNVTATPPPKEPDTSRRTSLPPKRRTLPPPPLPLTTEPTSIEPEASQVEDVSSTGPPVSSPAPPPLSAYPRPKRVSLPPSRLPPPPPTAPIQGSFAPQRQDSKDSQKPPIRKDSKPQAVSAPPSRILAHEIVQSSLPVKAEPQDEVEHVDDGKLHPPEREIMYDADTDPIDPSFYSPMRSPARLPYLEPESEEEEEAHEEVPPAEPTPPVEDEAAARKKTLAERMAKLGGIALGAPGPGGIPPRRPTQKADSVSKPEPSEDVAHEDPQGDADESEDAARARRAAIAARLAAGGGIKFGMMPGAKPPQPPVVQKPAEPEVEEGAHSDHEGLHGEPEEEQEEEDEDEAQDIEAPPPPPPPRTPRVLPPTPSIGASDPSVPPPLPPGRHVRPSASVPSTPLPRTPMFNIPPPPPPMSAIEPHRNDRHWQKPDEAIEEESDHSLPPPPPPPPPPPAPPIKLGRPQHGKRPSVSAIETAPAEPEAPPPPPAESSPIEVPGPDPATIGPAEHYTPTELQSIWQRVGLQVVSAAKVAAERSKKMVIADGTPGGFVEAALAAVPSARPISMINRYYGYPIYSQAGPHVEKKECEIMPGDIVALTDVKLKGFKGLQSYHLHIGTSGGPLLAIVQEYEGGKKHKLKVYQAALQSNTFPSVETTSYRLDDLKSGTIQVFRVEEQ